VARHAEAPDSFWIPSAEERQSLRVGNGAKLLFALADEAGDRLAAQVERMWVVVTEVTDDGYVGILASSPRSSHAAVHRGSRVTFAAEHICDIGAGPSREELDELRRDSAR
jgi:hypothetical protein